MSAPSFIKAADTTTSPEKSRADVERLLARYGAQGFGYDRDLERDRIAVRFTVPRAVGSAERVRVEIPVDVAKVYGVLRGMRRGRVAARDEARLRVQAERVAWRNLYLFVDAALALVALEIGTVEEAFMAHTIVTTPDGASGRVADFITGLRAAGKLLALPPGSGDA